MRTHGTVSCYQHDKCRCGDCRAAAAEARRHAPDRQREPEPRPDLSWFDDAACRDTDPSAFFPDSPHEVPVAAQLLCMTCATFDACFAYGLTQEWGVWAGMSEDERRRIRRDRRIPVTPTSHPLDPPDPLEEIA